MLYRIMIRKPSTAELVKANTRYFLRGDFELKARHPTFHHRIKTDTFTGIKAELTVNPRAAADSQIP